VSPSYTSGHGNLASRLRQIKYLWAFQTAGAAKDVTQMLKEAKSVCDTLKDTFGFEAEGKDVLEIGPGQFLTQARYFALKNKVTVIDADVLAERLSPGKLVQMLRRNGASRTLKTCARKAVGIDRIYRRATCRELGVEKLPQIRIEHGDAEAMPFGDRTFDMIQCRSVLHSLPHPEKAMSEIGRVLRPGGVAHIDIHLYTSYNGALDPRTMTGSDSTYFWAHLKHPPARVGTARLNKLTLQTWSSLFARELPGCIIRVSEDGPNIRKVLLHLRSKGELADYSDEQLMGHALDVMWQKPVQR